MKICRQIFTGFSLSKQEISKNRKYDHVFVVIRYDSVSNVALTRAFWDEEQARNEVARLNSLVEHRARKHGFVNDIVYDYQLARLEKRKTVRETSKETQTTE